MSSTGARRGVGAGSGHFPVGRRRHVPVVDTGCSCRPRRPRVQLSLPSFLKPSFASKPASAPGRSNSSSSFLPSSSSTASFSTSYASSNCSNYYSSYHGFGGAPKQPQEGHLPASKQVPAVTPASPVKRQPASAKKKQKKRYYVEKKAAMAEAEQEDVGLAVEKDSSDPRADFRESMVQMVVETGLCSWDDLRCMLRRLLALNSPRHHAAILTAFAELCAQLASPPPPGPAASSYHYQQGRRHYRGEEGRPPRLPWGGAGTPFPAECCGGAISLMKLFVAELLLTNRYLDAWLGQKFESKTKPIQVRCTGTPRPARRV